MTGVTDCCDHPANILARDSYRKFDTLMSVSLSYFFGGKAFDKRVDYADVDKGCDNFQPTHRADFYLVGAVQAGRSRATVCPGQSAGAEFDASEIARDNDQHLIQTTAVDR